MIRKLMMVLAAMACMAAPAKEGLLEIDFGYARLRGRTHSDGLVILRDAKKPVICRIRRINDEEREIAFVKWGEAGIPAFVLPVDGRGKLFLFVTHALSRDGMERKDGVAYLMDMGGRWAKGKFTMEDLGLNEFKKDGEKAECKQ